jgi:hypothetical protein
MTDWEMRASARSSGLLGYRRSGASVTARSPKRWLDRNYLGWKMTFLADDLRLDEQHSNAFGAARQAARVSVTVERWRAGIKSTLTTATILDRWVLCISAGWEWGETISLGTCAGSFTRNGSLNTFITRPYQKTSCSNAYCWSTTVASGDLRRGDYIRVTTLFGLAAESWGWASANPQFEVERYRAKLEPLSIFSA